VTRCRSTGPARAAGAALAVLAALVLVARGAGAEEARSPAPEAASVEFRPGIPGLKMADVREHKLLWRDIEELQTWEARDRISVAEYRSKVIEKTVHFLRLEGAAADGFASAASEAVAAVRRSFRERRADAKPGELEARLSSDLKGAVHRVSSLLRKEPRHQLFAPDCKKWLLRLAFGPREAKEAKEAKAAEAAKRGGS
jgi:hypothetical protein